MSSLAPNTSAPIPSPIQTHKPPRHIHVITSPFSSIPFHPPSSAPCTDETHAPRLSLLGTYASADRVTGVPTERLVFGHCRPSRARTHTLTCLFQNCRTGYLCIQMQRCSRLLQLVLGPGCARDDCRSRVLSYSLGLCGIKFPFSAIERDAE